MTTSVFLSASIPDPKRDPKYYETADVIAIRDAVRALATIVLPKFNLVWGGHPAITPLIRIVAGSVQVSVQERIWLYQSEFFKRELPEDNDAFERIVLIRSAKDREDSLLLMREAMMQNHNFGAGVFIGGMEGVEEEFALFRQYHHKARILPIASTGGAAQVLYRRLQQSMGLPLGLEDEFSYNRLFRLLVKELT